jgi:hypothetical protein
LSGNGEDEEREEAVYKTYVQPLRVPPPPAEPPAAPPEPEREPGAAASPPPLPQDAPPEPAGPATRAPETPPPGAAPRPAGDGVKDFEFRTAREKSGRRRVLARAVTAIVAAVGLALAYPLVDPFGSSTPSSLTRYLQRFQPIALRADQDRRSVQEAVKAARSNPKGRAAAARRLVRANRDRELLIRRLTVLGAAPGVARPLPGRLTRLLRIQIATGRVWQRWMQHRPFVYLTHDAATRNRVQALLHSQQASKGSFTRLYGQLMRAAKLPLGSAAGG